MEEGGAPCTTSAKGVIAGVGVAYWNHLGVYCTGQCLQVS